MKRIIALTAFFAVLSLQPLFAQCDEVANECESNFAAEFISDGQFYRALLYNDQVAEFDLSLFGGNTYRIAACSGMEDGNLVFRLYDQEHNLLFTSSDFSNAPYWDFVVENTMQCTIEAQLDLNKQQSGCAVLLIGFKK
ncbi:MAG: hypothetical protein RL226_2078 [Bacteroidota bacterium]|jgi:hypothetical protein